MNAESSLSSAEAANMESMSSFTLVKLHALDSETFEAEETKALH